MQLPVKSIDRINQSLVEFLNANEWHFNQKPNLIETGFTGEKKVFPLSIHHQATIVTFDCLLIRGRKNLDTLPSLTEFIAEMNRRTSLVKVMILDDHLVLRLDAFGEKLDLELFNLYVGVLAHYADLILDLILDSFEDEECFMLDFHSIS